MRTLSKSPISVPSEKSNPSRYERLRQTCFSGPFGHCENLPSMIKRMVFLRKSALYPFFTLVEFCACPTFTASFNAVFRYPVGIRLVEWMTMLTGCSGSKCFSYWAFIDASSNVLKMCHWLKMCRVDTSSIPTQMVNFEPIRNNSYPVLKRYAVGLFKLLSRSYTENTISASISVCDPLPTPIVGYFDFLKKSHFLSTVHASIVCMNSLCCKYVFTVERLA